MLTLTSLAVALVAVLLPLSPLAGWFHFARPPLVLYALIGALLLSYLALVEILKHRFFRRFADGR